ncbi:MAG: hypothetical protein IH946_05350, partial [Bacteroidetes bacterium]|nr:hypothetical protein [Bacteroidota bacterium]
PAQFPNVDKEYGFEYALLYRPEFTQLHHFLHKDPNWVLCYADPVTAVYIKRGGRHDEVIAKHGFLNDPAIYKEPLFVEPSGIAKSFSFLFWPFYDKYYMEVYDHDLTASSFFKSIREYKLAEQAAVEATQNNIDNYAAWEMLGYILLETGDIQTDPNGKQTLYQRSTEAFGNGIRSDKNRAQCYTGLAYAETRRNNHKIAQKWFKKALKVGKADASIFKSLADIQQILIRQDPERTNVYQQRWFEYLEAAYDINSDDMQTRSKLGLTYCQQNQCDKARKYLKGLQPPPDMSDRDRQLLATCKKKCGAS